MLMLTRLQSYCNTETVIEVPPPLPLHKANLLVNKVYLNMFAIKATKKGLKPIITIVGS